MERDKWMISKFIRYIYPSKQQKKNIIMIMISILDIVYDCHLTWG